MDEKEEIRLATLLAEAIDGKAGADALDSSVDGEVREAVEAAAFMGGVFADSPQIDHEFDSALRRKLVDETGQRAKILRFPEKNQDSKQRTGAKVIPLLRQPWFRTTLTAAMLVVMLTPYYFFRYLRPKQVELRVTQQIKQEKLEKYDKMYVPRLTRLKKELESDTSTKAEKQYFNKRREDRIQQILNRNSDLLKQAKIREAAGRRDNE
jgi:hypothetical protein